MFFLWFLNTDNQVENTRRSRVFLNSLSFFRNQRMNDFECSNLLLKLIPIFWGKSRLKLAKLDCNLPPFSKYWLKINFFEIFGSVWERIDQCMNAYVRNYLWSWWSRRSCTSRQSLENKKQFNKYISNASRRKISLCSSPWNYKSHIDFF